ncbi:putative permease, DMT superfamily [Corynebacterium mustelae]|uniref:Putative permease, DMT superfamily n=1 Tax=Corynebacterium mustelae TaxID=571915 RepID=A0A0G3GZ57_9CORY|nr:EamA family transporter [Corynebacterium mustelae]AKK06459.1 putative permease, DMT superfamily [Corynebacterium mustelae]
MTENSTYQRLAPIGLIIASGASVYIGAAVAVGLFVVLPPTHVAWLRVFCAGLIMTIIYRPHFKSFVGDKSKLAMAYGASMVLMNICFYNAIETIPLGTAVAVEFLGPIVVGAVASRKIQQWVALLLAAAGVIVLSGAQWTDNARGILFALGAAAGWGMYIAVGLKMSRVLLGRKETQQMLGVGLLYGALFALPLVVFQFPTSVPMDPATMIGLVVGLAVLSTVIPSSLEIVAMRLSSASLYAVLTALMPLVATICGAVMLGQLPTAIELVGIALVVVAVIVRR